MCGASVASSTPVQDGTIVEVSAAHAIALGAAFGQQHDRLARGHGGTLQPVAQHADTSPRAPVVLIVDDHQDSCVMYASALRFMGFLPITEETGELGFARACDTRPDAVVADVFLPGISGLELTRRLRNDPRTKNAAIILLTGRSYGVDEPRAAAAGCDRFLLKPCLPDELASEIRHALTTRPPAVQR